MGEFVHMKDFQTLLSALDRDPKSGKLLPTPQLAETFRLACPLDREGLFALVQCLNECSEQIYEYYRPMIDLFRAEIRHTCPDEETMRIAVSLGIADDEDFASCGKERCEA